MLNPQEINFLAQLQSHQILAVKQYAPDLEFSSRSISRIAVKQHPDIPCYVFSQALGLQRIQQSSDGERVVDSDVLPKPQLGEDPLLHYLKVYYESDCDGIFVFLDLHKYINPRNCDRAILSHLRTIATVVEQKECFKRLILLGQEIELPIELIRLIPPIEMPLPNIEIRTLTLRQKARKLGWQLDLEPVARATSGLTVREIFNQFECWYQRQVLEGTKLSAENLIAHFVEYKTKLLKSLKIDVVPPQEQNFGGHGVLRQWLKGVEAVLRPEAREYGIPFPKGCLLGGFSGVGKTLIAKAIASQWDLPLIKVSIPELKGSLVGESESNLKRVIELISSVEGVVLFDEIEKGVSNQINDSSGVTGGLLSILLQYMNEQTQHFIICTANRVDLIPAEFIRKGRLDEVWFANLPNQEERQEILRLHFFCQNRIAPDYVEQTNEIIDLLADNTEQFSGAELASLVEEGLKNIYLAGRGRQPRSSDFITLARNTVPLSRLQPEQHEKILAWSKQARHTSNYANS